jgi:hypothetical protein
MLVLFLFCRKRLHVLIPEFVEVRLDDPERPMPGIFPSVAKNHLLSEWMLDTRSADQNLQ